MRRMTATMLLGVALTATGMFAADGLTGTWKFNIGRSTSTSANPIKSQTDVREATPEGGMKLTRTGQLIDGTAINYTMTFNYDGKPYPVTGAPFDTITAKRIDASTTSFEVKKTGGKYHVTGRTTVSKDGKVLTQTAKGTDADGKPVSTRTIFDKQ